VIGEHFSNSAPESANDVVLFDGNHGRRLLRRRHYRGHIEGLDGVHVDDPHRETTLEQ
jgi:hypothetical protein